LELEDTITGELEFHAKSGNEVTFMVEELLSLLHHHLGCLVLILFILELILEFLLTNLHLVVPFSILSDLEFVSLNDLSAPILDLLFILGIKKGDHIVKGPGHASP